MMSPSHAAPFLHDVTPSSECVVPLAQVVAARRGGVPASRIGRILLDLAVDLEARHAQGTVHGHISYHQIVLDEDGVASWCEDEAEANGERQAHECCRPVYCGLAFEQLTHHAGWPVGPWTDVYGLCAVVYRLITGECPPCAIDRCLSDGYRPLAARGLTNYDPRFLRAIDDGLSFLPAQRPQTLSDFLTRAGVLSSRTGSQPPCGPTLRARARKAPVMQLRAPAPSDGMAYGPWATQPRSLDLGQGAVAGNVGLACSEGRRSSGAQARAPAGLSETPAARSHGPSMAPDTGTKPSPDSGAHQTQDRLIRGGLTRGSLTPDKLKRVAMTRVSLPRAAMTGAAMTGTALLALLVWAVAGEWVGLRRAADGPTPDTSSAAAVAGTSTRAAAPQSPLPGLSRADPYSALLDNGVVQSAVEGMGPALHANLWALTAAATQSELAPQPRRAPFAPLAGVEPRQR